MKNRLHQFNFAAGLQTSQAEDGLPLPAWVQFANARVHTAAGRRRAGKARVGTLTGDAAALDFDGAADYIAAPYDSRVWDLKKYWTLEVLCEPDDVTGTQAIVGFGHASEFPLRLYLNGGTLTCEVVDTATTVVTLTSATTFTATKLAIQITRAGTALTMTVNNVSEDTDTMADLNNDTVNGTLVYFARDNTGNYFDGTIDYVRLFSIARPRADDLLLRWPDPACDYCTAHYGFELTSDDLMKDTSRYGNTGLATSSPASITTLAHPYAPLQTITPHKTRSGEKRILMVAGGVPYNIEVA